MSGAETGATARPGLVARGKAVYRGLIAYALKFGVVGVLGLVVDITVFNLLRLSGEHLLSGPIGAKVVAVAAATVVTWFGNRYWTFREHRRSNYLLELAEFATVAVAGMAVNLLPLYISHYVLGFDNLVADNISANVIGLGLATGFRFVLYRYWVFGHHRSGGVVEAREAEIAAAAIFEDDVAAVNDTAPIRRPE
ncbi:GtrA family protein [Rathayibacter sp. VKM Ac-2803]|uniref:GtrA family protein n=1 Tax=unclassified Rathayibacter TaxID=2609250 RepID=UPI001357A086|nr:MULTISPECIES: GtrA family protein [unclassified Rathayibacter]MWV50581.1 GtrA family protein [Rathayibacter sp. VKM Ac-2803]MWV59582.1 GtrA family protein [Rathayibacter sp. VKM Ac-2754]